MMVRFPGRYRYLALVLVASAALNLTGIFWGLPNYYPTWESDNIGSASVLGHMYHMFSGDDYKYPPFHFFVSAVFYLPYLVFLRATGGLASPSSVFPFGFADPLSALTALTLITRLINIAMGVGIVLFVYLSSREMFDDSKASLFSAIILSLCPLFIALSKISRIDVPMMFHVTVSLYFYIRALKGGRKRDYALFGLFAALAMSTKDQAAAVFALPVIGLLVWRVRHRRKSGMGLRDLLYDRKVICMVLAFAITYVLANNMVMDLQGYVNRTGHWLGGAGVTGYVEYQNSLTGHALLLSETAQLLLFAMTTPMFLVSVLAFAHLLRRPGKGRLLSFMLLLALISYYAFSIFWMRFVYPRHVLPMIVPLAMVGGKLMSDAWGGGSLRKMLVLCMVAFSVTQAVGMDYLMLNDSRYHAEAWLLANVDKGSTIDAWMGDGELNRLKIMNFTNAYSTDWRNETALGFESRGAEYVMFDSVAYDGAEGEQREALSSLMSGDAGYRTAKAFKTPGFMIPSMPLFYINPGITVMERSD